MKQEPKLPPLLDDSEPRRYICPDCGRDRGDIVALTYHRMGCREDQERRNKAAKEAGL